MRLEAPSRSDSKPDSHGITTIRRKLNSGCGNITETRQKSRTRHKDKTRDDGMYRSDVKNNEMPMPAWRTAGAELRRRQLARNGRHYTDGRLRLLHNVCLSASPLRAGNSSMADKHIE